MYIKNSKMRKKLISISQNIKSSFNIGKINIDENYIIAIDEYLNANEIIKIHMLNNCNENIIDLSNHIADKTHSEVVAIIGKKIILYKPKKDITKRKIIL